MKVMTIVGTRPEIIKMSRVIDETKKYMDHVLVHTGQNYDYELNEVFFKDLQVPKPDHFLEVAADTVARSIGNVIALSDEVMEKEQPDAVMLYGDTNSCLAVIAAKRRKIPVFHFEAGNRCFDQRVPEELNRKVLDHLSDINFPLTEHARRYLIAEGIPADRVIKIGSPMQEIINFHRESIDQSSIHQTLDLKPREYFIVSIHREENVDSEENFVNLLDSLNALAEKWNYPVIVATHPRTMKRLQEGYLDDGRMNKLVQFMKPMGFFDYIKMQEHSFCVISDSGTITEESSLLNFPAITVRQAHERPEGMDEGAIIMSGLLREDVVKSVTIVTDQHNYESRAFKKVFDYDVDNVSKKVVRILMSYTNFVNRTVWRKP
jgi:UDP-N-acetylglucosamine 2-epimerase (non-hydrolysing)